MSVTLKCMGETRQISILARKPHLVVSVDGREHVITSQDPDSDTIDINGTSYRFKRAVDGNTGHLWFNGDLTTVELVDPRDVLRSTDNLDDVIHAPMPGLVVSIDKAPGDTVEFGDVILVIESMKLQTSLTAPRDGIVAEITKAQDELFGKDDILATLIPVQGE